MAYLYFFLISGRNRYIHKPPQGSIITDIFRIIAVAVKRKRSLKNAPESIRCGGLLDYARVRYGGPYLDGQVDTVLSLARIVPILATLIIYWVIYFQVGDSTIHTGNSWFSMNSTIFRVKGQGKWSSPICFCFNEQPHGRDTIFWPVML